MALPVADARFPPCSLQLDYLLQPATAQHEARDLLPVAQSCHIVAWYCIRPLQVDYYVGVPVWILVLGGAGIVVGLGT